MAIRFTVRGVEFETDSADEAQEVLDRFNITNKTEQAEGAKDAEDDEANDDDEGLNGNSRHRVIVLGSNAKTMLKKLIVLDSGYGSGTKVVAEALGVNGAKGLAAVTRQIRQWGYQQWGFSKKDCVDRFVGKNGGSFVKLGSKLRSKIKGHETEYLD